LVTAESLLILVAARKIKASADDCYQFTRRSVF
jgi:hypothetical protein